LNLWVSTQKLNFPIGAIEGRRNSFGVSAIELGRDRHWFFGVAERITDLKSRAIFEFEWRKDGRGGEGGSGGGRPALHVYETVERNVKKCDRLLRRLSGEKGGVGRRLFVEDFLGSVGNERK
jgi:hypothetical protein